MQRLEIQGFTYSERHRTVPELTLSAGRCGGQVLGSRVCSKARMEFEVEIPLDGAVEFYLSMMAAGVELTRRAHLALHDLCTCRKHSRSEAELGRVVEVRMEITFLAEKKAVAVPEGVLVMA